MRRLLITLFIFIVILVSSPSRASAENLPEKVGWGMCSILVTTIYLPLKTTYAILGGITGCLAYLVTGGDLFTASFIWIPTIQGDYIITPAMLKGEKKIRFRLEL